VGDGHENHELPGSVPITDALGGRGRCNGVLPLDLEEILMDTEPTATATDSIVACEQQLAEHEMRFAGTTAGSGFRYSVIRVIGGNMRNPMPVESAIVRVERSLRDG